MTQISSYFNLEEHSLTILSINESSVYYPGSLKIDFAVTGLRSVLNDIVKTDLGKLPPYVLTFMLKSRIKDLNPRMNVNEIEVSLQYGGTSGSYKVVLATIKIIKDSKVYYPSPPNGFKHVMSYREGYL